MIERIPAGKAAKQWAKLLDRARAGEEFVITRDGVEIAMLGPIRFRGEPPKPIASRRYNDAAVSDILKKAFPGKKKG